jgi:hypothetical protein
MRTFLLFGDSPGTKVSYDLRKLAASAVSVVFTFSCAS